MATTYETKQEVVKDEKNSTLITDVLKDAHALLLQHLALFKAELRAEIEKAKLAFLPLVLGVVFALTGSTILALAIGNLLVWLIPDLPMWGALAMTGITVLGAALGLLYLGKKQCETMQASQKTFQSIKERLQ